MALTASLINGTLSIDNTQSQFLVDFTIAFSGNYGTSGGALPHGDTLDLSVLGVPSSQLPTLVTFQEVVPTGNAPRLTDVFIYLPGTTQANGVLQIGVAGSEITPGNAYSGQAPFNVSGFVLNGRAWFQSY